MIIVGVIVLSIVGIFLGIYILSMDINGQEENTHGSAGEPTLSMTRGSSTE